MDVFSLGWTVDMAKGRRQVGIHVRGKGHMDINDTQESKNRNAYFAWVLSVLFNNSVTVVFPSIFYICLTPNGKEEFNIP